MKMEEIKNKIEGLPKANNKRNAACGIAATCGTCMYAYRAGTNENGTEAAYGTEIDGTYCTHKLDNKRR